MPAIIEKNPKKRKIEEKTRELKPGPYGRKRVKPNPTSAPAPVVKNEKPKGRDHILLNFLDLNKALNQLEIEFDC